MGKTQIYLLRIIPYNIKTKQTDMENSKQPAYPIVGMAFNEETKGLTKRELIAAMAMSGFLANVDNDKYCISYLQFTDSAENKAKFCVELTDALLTELDKPTNK